MLCSSVLCGQSIELFHIEEYKYNTMCVAPGFLCCLNMKVQVQGSNLEHTFNLQANTAVWAMSN